MVSHELQQTKRSMGTYCQENDTAIRRSVASDLFCSEPFFKRDLMSKKGQQTVHFQSMTQTKTIIIRTILGCNQSCIHAAVCVLGLTKTKKLVVVKDQIFPQTRHSHELDTPKRSNSFGGPNARQQRQKHHCSSVTRGKFLSKSWQRPILWEDGRWYAERKHYLAAIQIHNWNAL